MRNFFLYVYLYSLRVSASRVPIIRRSNCINVTPGICHSMYIHTYIYIYIYTYTHIYTYIYTCDRLVYRSELPAHQTVTCMYICIYVYVYMYMCMYICIYMYIYVYIYMYIHSDIYHVSHWYNYFSWWLAHGCPKHVENINKHIRKNCIKLVYLQRLY